MASIRKEILIEGAPELVWSAVRDVGAVHRRLVPGYVLDTRLDRDFRILTLPGGGEVRELIVDVDVGARRLAYAVIEGRMPITHHSAWLQVFAEGGDRSRLVWGTDVLPNDLATELSARVEQGAAVMKRTLEEQAGHVQETSGR